MDLEKQVQAQSKAYNFKFGKSNIKFINKTYLETYSLDWKCDGNLIAFGDAEYDPKIYDIREGKVVKAYVDTFASKNSL